MIGNTERKFPNSRNHLEELVGAIGFEPTTPCAQGRCATRLRYAPTLLRFYSIIDDALADSRRSGPRYNSNLMMQTRRYALVAYVRNPVGEFVERLRQELHPDLPHLPAHLTVLPPR